jgi:hypothetical protein
MRKLFIMVASALLVVPTAAMAQSADPSTGSTTASGSAQAANNVTVVADAGRYAPADSSVHYSGHTWTTPGVGGSYFGGANPCLVGNGGGAAAGPIGISLNFGKNDKGCTRRSNAAAWHALGMDNVAVAQLCQDVASADAFFAATGMACPGTQNSGRYKLADGSPAPAAYIPNERTAELTPQTEARPSPKN